jgi:hypothetical protein
MSFELYMSTFWTEMFYDLNFLHNGYVNILG